VHLGNRSWKGRDGVVAREGPGTVPGPGAVECMAWSCCWQLASCFAMMPVNASSPHMQVVAGSSVCVCVCEIERESYVQAGHEGQGAWRLG
jgi:hypothetical protein